MKAGNNILTLQAGLDEAGRGPLAGPVSAACVVLPDDFPPGLLADSKKLSEKKRIAAEAVIKEKCCWGFATASHQEIDSLNILQASLLAMKRAFEQMAQKLPEWLESKNLCARNFSLQNINCIVDGLYVPDILCNAQAVVKADSKYPSVMAASIIAKVGRDRIMEEYSKLYPQYLYSKHKGYPTKLHKELCKKYGPSPIQRLTFKY